ncbi:MAG: hypothetical protein M1823_001636 [Watsoniomyces obsoletus]|nr:MAG: hypothetical protein M1823_001636 [Watsoniomyces obsoletus]
MSAQITERHDYDPDRMYDSDDDVHPEKSSHYGEHVTSNYSSATVEDDVEEKNYHGDTKTEGQLLRCDFPGCTLQPSFTRKSDLKKHRDRHTRPYSCSVTGCKAPSFGDVGGLFRHQREVHKARDGDRPVTEYFCPEPSCERYRRGFPRRWNLLEHQRRIHGVGRDGGMVIDDRKSSIVSGSGSRGATTSSSSIGRSVRRASRGVVGPTTMMTSSLSSRPMSPMSSLQSQRHGYSVSPTTTATAMDAQLSPRHRTDSGLSIASLQGEYQTSMNLRGGLNGHVNTNGDVHVNGDGKKRMGNTMTPATSIAGITNGIGPSNHHSNDHHSPTKTLHDKLKELEYRKTSVEQEKDRLEKDIQAVKHTLRVLGGGMD